MQVRKSLFLLFVIICLLTTLDSCNKCSMDSGGIFFQQLWRTWKLVKVVYPSKTQTIFPYIEMLKIGLSDDGHGNAITKEIIVRTSPPTKDSVHIGTNEWRGFGENCSNTTVSVMYSNGLQRKYFLSNRGEAVEATEYTNQIGGSSDTIRYFYESVQ